MKLNLIVICLISLAFKASGQGTAGGSAPQTNATEKTFLHLDRQQYAGGDTVRYKAYLLGEGNAYSTLSSMVHVQLVRPDGKPVLSQRIKATSGVAAGQLAIPDTLSSGVYAVTAYTDVALTSRDAYHALQTIAVYSRYGKVAPAVTAQVAGKPEVRFMPEGGVLLAGIESRVAFSATGANGLGMNVSGQLRDSVGNKIADISTAHAGMGKVTFIPKATSYYAELKDKQGNAYKVKLPAVQKNGIRIVANNDSAGKVMLYVQATDQYFKTHQKQDYKINIKAPGVQTAVPFKLDQSEMRFDILKRNFNTGVADFALMSGETAVSERMVYMPSQNGLNITSQTKKVGDSTEVRLMVKNKQGAPVKGNFSVAVVNDQFNAPNLQRTMGADLLLTSQLNGFVENPAYYFGQNSPARQQQLDVLMLTHGLRQNTPDAATAQASAPSAKGFALTGTLTTLKNEPVSGGKVYLTEPLSKTLLTQVTDQSGRFTFTGLDYSDTARLMLNAVDQRGSNKVKMDIDKDKTPAAPLSEVDNFILSSAVANFDAAQKPALIPVYQTAATTTTGDERPFRLASNTERRDAANYRTLSLAGAGHADQVLHIRDVKGNGTLDVVLNGRLRGIVFDNGVPFISSIYPQWPMMIVVDGTILTSSDGGKVSVRNIDAGDVETVEVLKYENASVYGLGSAGGVLVITTKNQESVDLADRKAANGMLSFKKVGFNNHLPYSDYDYRPAAPQRAGTLLWKPNVFTNSNGEIVFKVPALSSGNKYVMTLQGITTEGDVAQYETGL